jgi:hypothetical protein
MSKSKLTTEELCTKSSTKSVTSASLAKGISTLLKLKGEFDDYHQALVDWIDHDRHAHNVRPGSREFRGRAKNARHNTRGHCERALLPGYIRQSAPAGCWIVWEGIPIWFGPSVRGVPGHICDFGDNPIIC